MAAAAGSSAATTLPTPPSSSASFRRSSQLAIFSKPSLACARVSATSPSLNPRCDVVSYNSVQKNKIAFNASSPSPLRLLKTSAPNRYTKERSSIIVIGLNIHTAPVDIREKLAIPEVRWPQVITELCALNHIEEAAVLSTCNRMEIYVVALSQHRGVKEVTEWISKASGVSIPELCKHQVLLYNKDATQHLFEVAAGLDSLVLGEGQILSHVKQVVKSGEGVAGFDGKISGMFKQAISVGKRVRIDTSICSGSVSVNVDDLEEVVAADKEDRLQKATEARVIIQEELNKFEAWKDSLETVPTIKKFRAYVERIRASEVEKCLSKMGNDISKEDKEAIYALSMGIVSDILHGPMQQMRCDGNDNHCLSEVLENMRALNRMYDLETEISMMEEKIRVKMGRTKK